MNPNRDNQIAGMLRGEKPPMKPFSIPKPKPRLGLRRSLPTPKQTARPAAVPKPLAPPPSAYENDVYSDNEKD